MKKGLLSIAAGLLISMGASAQTYNPDLWVVDDGTDNVQSLTGITEANGIEVSGDAQYAVTWIGDEMQVEWTRDDQADPYADFSMSFIQWEGMGVDGAEIGKKFVKDTAGNDQESDKARGFSVDFSNPDNALITFEYKTSATDVTLRMDVGDIAGKSSNTSSPAYKLPAVADWTEISYSWGDDATATVSVDKITDSYTGDWWEIGSVNDYNVAPAPNVSYLRGGKNAEVPMETDKIVKIAFSINPGVAGAAGATSSVVNIRNIKVGAADNPTTYVKWEKVGIEDVSAATLEVVDGVIYSEGTITVTGITGQVVAVAEGELSIASLPAGAYVIVAPEGSTKIVK